MKTVIACITAAFVSLSSAADRPDNFVQWRDGLASSAQPSADWLGRVKEMKYDVLINLAPPQSHGRSPTRAASWPRRASTT